MSISATCQCGREFHVKAIHAGKTGKCPTCGAMVSIPQMAPEVWPTMLQTMPAPGPLAIQQSDVSPQFMEAPPLAAMPRSRNPGRGKIWAVVIATVVLAGGGFAAYEAGWLGGRNAANPAGPPAPTTPGGALITRIISPDPTARPIDHPQAIELKTKFVPGVYDLSESMETRLQISAEGQSMNMSMSSTIDGDIEIGAPDTTREQLVRFVCRRVKMSNDAQIPGMASKVQSFDSDSPPNTQDAMMDQMLSPMIGWEGRMWCRDGKFTRADGLVSLMSQIRASASPQTAQMVGNLEKMMGDFLKEILTQHYGEVLPAQAVPPGAKWKAKIKIKSAPMLGAMDVDCDCMLHRIERGSNGADVAVIGFTASSVITNRDMDLSELSGGGPKAHIDSLNITEFGVFHFDTALGLSTRVGMEGTVSGTLSMPQGPGGKTSQISMSVDMGANNLLSRNTSGPRPPPARRFATNGGYGGGTTGAIAPHRAVESPDLIERVPDQIEKKEIEKKRDVEVDDVERATTLPKMETPAAPPQPGSK